MTAARTPPNAEPAPSIGQPLILAVCQIFVAAILGLIVLPSVLTDPIGVGTPADWPVRPEAAVWLGCAAVLVVWVIVVAPHLARSLAAPLGAAPWRGRRENDAGTRIQDAHFLAGLLVAVLGTALIAAILRRPLVMAAASLAPPLEVDAIVATANVVIILALALRLYLAARPFVEGSAWLALDSLVPTSGSEAASRFSDGFDVATQPRPVSSVAAGRVAAQPLALDATVAAAVLDATIAAPRPDAAPTLPALPTETLLANPPPPPRPAAS